MDIEGQIRQLLTEIQKDYSLAQAKVSDLQLLMRALMGSITTESLMIALCKREQGDPVDSEVHIARALGFVCLALES